MVRLVAFLLLLDPAVVLGLGLGGELRRPLAAAAVERGDQLAAGRDQVRPVDPAIFQSAGSSGSTAWPSLARRAFWAKTSASGQSFISSAS